MATAAQADRPTGRPTVGLGRNLLLDRSRPTSRAASRARPRKAGRSAYKKITGRWASWSGEREGRIFFARAIILCHDDQAGFFQLEYPAELREDFDAVVKRLVKGFKPHRLPIVEPRGRHLGGVANAKVVKIVLGVAAGIAAVIAVDRLVRAVGDCPA